MFKASLNRVFAIFLIGFILGSCAQPETKKEEAGVEFRAPAYPLITIDP
jgi:hypothetical protein